MATYMVTGCSGFIASRVTVLLLEAGHAVIGIDNLNDSCDLRLKHWRLAQVQDHPAFTFHEADICHRAELDELFQRQPIDGVVNLAARAGVRYSVINPWVYTETNLTGVLNLLELCRSHAVAKFVQASTSSLYGAINPRPFQEDANTNQPLSPYAASKKASETMCYTYHYLHGIDVTVFRFFTVYGPAGRPDMSPFRFVQWISENHPVTVYGDGQQSRDFTYVDDIARGVIAGLKPLGYEIINLGSDQPVVLMDFLHLVEELVGKQAVIDYQPRHSADMLHTWADINKAERLLGWRPQTPFVDGVRQTVEWYQTHRDWAKDIATQ